MEAHSDIIEMEPMSIDQPRPIASIETLPDLCLIAIFTWLPVRDLIITIPATCPRWADLCKDARNRHHTILLVDKYYICSLIDQTTSYTSPLYQYLPRGDRVLCASPFLQWSRRNSLELPRRVPRTYCTKLTKLFPKINKLTVCKKNANSGFLHQCTLMIDCWKSSLVSLKFSFEFTHQSEDILEELGTLFAFINGRLDALKRFEWMASDSFMPDLAFLSRLSYFGLSYSRFCSVNFDHYFGGLSRYGQLEHVSFFIPVGSYTHLKPPLTAKVTSLALNYISFDNIHTESDIFHLIIRFPSLTYLRLHLAWSTTDVLLSMSNLSRVLAQLPQLVHLELRRLENCKVGELSEYVPVTSVRMLTLHLDDHSSLSRFELHKIFPNLEMCAIRLPTCDTCLHETHFRRVFDHKAFWKSLKSHKIVTKRVSRSDNVQCRNLTIRPLLHFSKIHTLDLNRELVVFHREGKPIPNCELCQRWHLLACGPVVHRQAYIPIGAIQQ